MKTYLYHIKLRDAQAHETVGKKHLEMKLHR